MYNKFKMRVLFILLFVCGRLYSQKVTVDINVGLGMSVNKNKLATYRSTLNSFTLQYFSAKKYQYPDLNIKAQACYKLSKNIAVGVQSGIALHYLEKYFTNRQKTTEVFILQGGGRYFREINRGNEIGANVFIGKALFTIAEFPYKIASGNLYSFDCFYKIKQKHLLKMGIDLQADKVSYSYIPAPGTGTMEIYQYKLKRTIFFISYGIVIK
jgi:hypothetical protein